MIKKKNKLFVSLFVCSTLFFSSFVNAGGKLVESQSVKIDALIVTVDSFLEGKLMTHKIKVYKEDKHVFSYDCANKSLCKLFTTNESDPEYVYSDGLVQPSKSILPISIGNINRFT